MCGVMWCPPLHVESDEQKGRMLFYMTAALRASNAHSMRVWANCLTVTPISREVKRAWLDRQANFALRLRGKKTRVQDPYCE